MLVRCGSRVRLCAGSRAASAAAARGAATAWLFDWSPADALVALEAGSADDARRALWRAERWLSRASATELAAAVSVLKVVLSAFSLRQRSGTMRAT